MGLPYNTCPQYNSHLYLFTIYTYRIFLIPTLETQFFTTKFITKTFFTTIFFTIIFITTIFLVTIFVTKISLRHNLKLNIFYWTPRNRFYFSFSVRIWYGLWRKYEVVEVRQYCLLSAIWNADSLFWKSDSPIVPL